MSSQETLEESQSNSDTQSEETLTGPATLEPGEHRVAIDAPASATDEELREQLVAELDDLTERVQTLEPDYEPPPFSPQRLIAVVEQILSRLPRDLQLGALDRLRGALRQVSAA